MDGGRLLQKLTTTLIALGAVVLFVGVAPIAANAVCSEVEANLTGCVNDDDVSLEGDGSDDNPGGGGSGGSGGAGSGGGSGGGGTSGDNGDAPDCDMRECFEVINPGDPGDPARRVTWSDIARFRPAPEVDHMEPNGWMVVGLETNFYATGGVRIVPGELLGSDAAVRFTPVRWNWAYGDGANSTEGTRGAPWRANNDREFDETATSHVYQRAGTYYIDLVVDYTAEYRFGSGPWVAIDGVLSVPTNRLRATAGSAQTLLFEQDCSENPGGAGC